MTTGSTPGQSCKRICFICVDVSKYKIIIRYNTFHKVPVYIKHTQTHAVIFPVRRLIIKRQLLLSIFLPLLRPRDWAPDLEDGVKIQRGLLPGFETKWRLLSQTSQLLGTVSLSSFFLIYNAMSVTHFISDPLLYFMSRKFVFWFYRYTGGEKICSRMDHTQNFFRILFRRFRQ